MSNKLNGFVRTHLTTDRVAFEQVERGSGGVVGQDLGVARVGRVGRGMSLFDASFLADEFKGVPKDGDAEDAGSCGQ